MTRPLLHRDAYSVAPLTSVSERDIEAVLRSMSDEWLATLSWDLSNIVPVLKQAIREEIVRGAMLFASGHAAGLGFFSTEADRAFIGECYVSPKYRGAHAARVLTSSVLGHVERVCPGTRVELQTISFDSSGLDEALLEAGFRRATRAYMIASLDSASAPDDRPRAPGVDVRPWLPTDFEPAVAAILESYRGHVEAEFNHQYTSFEGVADLLEALTGSFWCGRFDPELTQVAVDRENGECCGIAVVSLISETTLHISQISVSPAHQRHGIGRRLVDRVLAAATRRGLERATLVVTRENQRAYQLYLNCGFVPRLEFPVFYRPGAEST